MFQLQSRNTAAAAGEVVIPLADLRFSYSRSSGPGGQNVNKVSSKVTLKWDFWASEAISMEQKGTLQRDPVLVNRINSDGLIVLHEQQTRSQDENRRLVVKKLHDLVRDALVPKLERIETKIPAGKKRRRLEGKRRHSRRKQERSQDFSAD